MRSLLCIIINASRGIPRDVGDIGPVRYAGARKGGGNRFVDCGAVESCKVHRRSVDEQRKGYLRLWNSDEEVGDVEMVDWLENCFRCQPHSAVRMND